MRGTRVGTPLFDALHVYYKMYTTCVLVSMLGTRVGTPLFDGGLGEGIEAMIFVTVLVALQAHILNRQTHSQPSVPGTHPQPSDTFSTVRHILNRQCPDVYTTLHADLCMLCTLHSTTPTTHFAM
jgi:hypothetical protein